MLSVARRGCGPIRVITNYMIAVVVCFKVRNLKWSSSLDTAPVSLAPHSR